MIIIKKKYCELCGKTNTTNNFIHIFKDGNTENNHPKNLQTVCPNCAKVWKVKRLYDASVTLHKLGFCYIRNKWRYDRKLIKNELTNVESLEHQIKVLKDKIKDYEHLLNIK